MPTSKMTPRPRSRCIRRPRPHLRTSRSSNNLQQISSAESPRGAFRSHKSSPRFGRPTTRRSTGEKSSCSRCVTRISPTQISATLQRSCAPTSATSWLKISTKCSRSARRAAEIVRGTSCCQCWHWTWANQKYPNAAPHTRNAGWSRFPSFSGVAAHLNSETAAPAARPLCQSTGPS